MMPRMHYERIMLHGNKKAICATNATTAQLTEHVNVVTCLDCIKRLKRAGKMAGLVVASSCPHGCGPASACRQNGRTPAGSAEQA